MDKPISVGDLVVVVRPAPCGCVQAIGMHFIVPLIRVSRSGYSCLYCAARRPLDLCVDLGDCLIEVYRIKLIPPLADLEGKKDAADKPITLDGEIERLRKMVQA